MAIHATCPSCKSEVHVDDDLAGAEIPCPNCDAPVMVPSIATGRPQPKSSGGSDRYDDDDSTGSLPRFQSTEDDDLSSRRDNRRWQATLTGLNLIFWTLLFVIILAVAIQGIALAMGGDPQALAGNPGAPPPPALVAAGLGFMVLGCLMIVLLIIGFVGMCMCCTAPSESGAKGKAITAVILVVLIVLGAIVLFIAAMAAAMHQMNQFGQPQPGEVPFSPEVMVGVTIGFTIIGALLAVTWILFHKAIGDHFQNGWLSRGCVYFIVIYLASSVGSFLLNLISNPIFQGGNVGQIQFSIMMIVAQVVGLVVAVGLGTWYLILLRETRRTILEGPARLEQAIDDGRYDA